MKKSPWSLLVLILVAIAVVWWFRYRAVDTRPLPQAQPTLDVLQPTQPIRELAPTATPTPTSTPTPTPTG